MATAYPKNCVFDTYARKQASIAINVADEMRSWDVGPTSHSDHNDMHQ